MKLKNVRTGRLMSVQAPVFFLARDLSAGNGQPSGGKALQCQPDRRRRDAHPAGDLVNRHPGRLQTKHIAHLAR